MILDEMLEELKEKGASDNDISLILSYLVWYLYDHPDLTPEEGLQDCLYSCLENGHIEVPDWDQEIKWNEHFILLPQKCRICGVKFFEVIERTPVPDAPTWPTLFHIIRREKNAG